MKNLKNTIVLLIALSSCSYHKLTKQHLEEVKHSEKEVIIYNVKFKYGSKYRDISKSSPCVVHFSDQNRKPFKSLKISKEINNSNYLVIEKDKDQRVTLDNIYCSQYRVLWNKDRYKKVKQKIDGFKHGEKFVYGGDIEINWKSKMFNISDLFYLGHMGINDKGKFSLKVTDSYKDYQDKDLFTYLIQNID